MTASRPAGGQRGEISLTGLLMACSLLVVVLAMTLTVFDGFTTEASMTSRRTDAQDVARSAADQLARELRNLSSPTPEQPEAIDRATPNDLVFKSVDPAGPNSGANVTNTRRIRWCLDDTGRLAEQVQSWTTAAAPPLPPGVGCPGPGWATTQVRAQHITNGAEAVFSYDAAAVADISAIHLDLHVDTDPGVGPPPTTLSTGVFLRNQNRRPRAAFAATRTAGGFVLNGSLSTDPEGDPLQYSWFDGARAVGTGITLVLDGLTPGSSHAVRLEVGDPAGLRSASATQVLQA